jgi:hypothetical protein
MLKAISPVKVSEQLNNIMNSPRVNFWTPKDRFYTMYKHCHICNLYEPDTQIQSEVMLTLDYGTSKRHFGMCLLHKDGILQLAGNHKASNPELYYLLLDKMLGIVTGPVEQPRQPYVIPEYAP